MRPTSWLLLALVAGAGPAPDGGVAAPRGGVLEDTHLDVRDFRLIERDSGPVNYYATAQEDGAWLLRARYRPPVESATAGIEVPEPLRQKVKRVRWRWRVHALPPGADECTARGDSAAAVMLTFKAGMKWMVLKYVWTTVGTVGQRCEQANGWFLARSVTTLEKGPSDDWRTEEVDPRAEFVKAFGGKPEDVPDFVGIGVRTDGDQTLAPSEGDYADFTLRW